MSEPDTKKPKVTPRNTNKKYYSQKSRKHFIEPGQRGFLATCNFREKDCVRECYNVLNQYADELYGPVEKSGNGAAEDDHDIGEELEQQINEAKLEAKSKKFRFQAVDTETNNCIFIKTSIADPVDLGVKIVRDIAASKKQTTRHLLRLVPIARICKAKMKDIVDSAGALFDEYFLKEAHTYSIVFNRRYNNSIKRDECIKDLADLIAAKNTKNKVDLSQPELSVIVEVIKGVCCLSVLPDYMKLRKYNLVELAKTCEEPKDESKISSEENSENIDDKSCENN